MRDRVSYELEARLDELIGQAPVDRLVRAAGPYDDRAAAAPRLGLDGRREPAEHPADRRLPHGRELLLRVGDAIAEHVLDGVEARGGDVELLAEGAQRGGDDLEAAQRGRRRSPGARRADEPEGLDDPGAVPPHRHGRPMSAVDAGRDALARALDHVEPLEEAVDVDGRDADRGGRLVEPGGARRIGLERSRRVAWQRLDRRLRRTASRPERVEGRVGVVEQGAEDDAPLRDLLHRGARRLPGVDDAPRFLESMAEPAHRLVAHGAAGALEGVHVPVESTCRLDRVLAGRERAVDACQPVDDLRGVLRSREGIERTRDEVVGRHGPARLDGGLAGAQAYDGHAHGRRSLSVRRVVILADAPVEPLERGGQLALAREAGASLQGVDGTLRLDIVARLALERHEVPLQLLDEQPR